MSNSRRTTDDGFTLVEILIVIVILGIVATVVVVAVRNVRSEGQDSACQAEQRTMINAAEAYLAQSRSDTIPVSDPAIDGVSGPTAELTLLEAEIINQVSPTYNVLPDGRVIAQAGAACA